MHKVVHSQKRGGYASLRHGGSHLAHRLWQMLTNPCLDDIALALAVIAVFVAVYYLCGMVPRPHPWTNPYAWMKSY